MPAVNNVLVVGAGLAGAGAAIHLASAGVAVDLIEIKPEVAALGSGITLQGNALRELRSLGVWDQVEQHGYAFDVTGIRAGAAEARVAQRQDEQRQQGELQEQRQPALELRK